MLDDNGHHSQTVATCLGLAGGLKLHVLSNNPWVAVRFSRYSTTFRTHSASDEDEPRLHDLRTAIKESNADVLLPVVESGIRLLANHGDTLKTEIAIVPVPDVDTLDLVGNKHALAVFLARHHIPSPPTFAVTSVEELERNANQLSFPLLLKPARGCGGIGIERFDTAPALLSFVKANPILPTPHILQPLIHGHDIDCSVLCRDGHILAHTIQMSLLPRRNPFGRDDAIEFVEHETALAVVKKLVAALRWSGIAHMDLRYDEHDGQIKVLDFNPRYWTSLLGSLAAGVNFPHLSCLAAMGIEFPPPVFAPIRFFTAPAALKQFIGNRFGRGAAGMRYRETGLRYALDDPAPRAFNLAKRAASLCRELSRRRKDAAQPLVIAPSRLKPAWFDRVAR